MPYKSRSTSVPFCWLVRIDPRPRLSLILASTLQSPLKAFSWKLGLAARFRVMANSPLLSWGDIQLMPLPKVSSLSEAHIYNPEV